MKETDSALKNVSRVSGPANLVWSEEGTYSKSDLKKLLSPRDLVSRKIIFIGKPPVESVASFIGFYWHSETNQYERRLFYISSNGEDSKFKLSSDSLDSICYVV